MNDSVAETAQETPVADTAQNPQVEATPAAAKTLFDAETKQAPVVAKPEEVKTELKPETKKEEPPAEKKEEVAAIKYDLKLPADSKLKANDLEKIASIAKERGFTQEQAQTLVDQKHEALSEYVLDQQKQLEQQSRVQWVSDAKSDPEIGGEGFNKNTEIAKRVVQRFGTDSFKKALDTTGLGNHPELLRVFTRIGKAMEPHDFVKPGSQPSGVKKSAEEQLYGTGK